LGLFIAITGQLLTCRDCGQVLWFGWETHFIFIWAKLHKFGFIRFIKSHQKAHGTSSSYQAFEKQIEKKPVL